MKLRKIAFVPGDFTLGMPGQQLLDRFLVGYPHDGEFRRFPDVRVALWSATTSDAEESALTVRQRGTNLARAASLAEAVSDAEAILITPRAGAVTVEEQLLTDVLTHARAGARCFVYGCLPGGANAQRFLSLAEGRGIMLSSGTSMSTTFRLPDVQVNEGTSLKEALIVVQGRRPEAELAGMDGLMPIVGRRVGGETGIQQTTLLEGRQVWRAGEAGRWSMALLAAALSRSNTTQGDPVRDGRTQDLVGKGLIQKLAIQPRAWLAEHRDGLRSAVLVLNGVVADCNFAVQTAEGLTLSAQLYRPPAPNRSEYDRFASAVEDFFRGGSPVQSAWSLAIAQFLGEVGEGAA